MEAELLYDNYKIQICTQAVWVAVTTWVCWMGAAVVLVKYGGELLRNAYKRRLVKDVIAENARMAELAWKEAQYEVNQTITTGQLFNVVTTKKEEFDPKFVSGYIILRDYGAYAGGGMCICAAIICLIVAQISMRQFVHATAAPDDYVMERLESRKVVSHLVFKQERIVRIPADKE